MVETAAPAPALKDAPITVRGPRGRFAKGTRGKMAGRPDRRTTVDRQLLKAIAEKHLARTLERLFHSKSERIQFEAVRWTGEMLLGRPKVSMEIEGGLSDLGRELSEALRLARVRRAALDMPLPVTGFLDAPTARPAEAEIVADMPVLDEAEK